MKIPGNSKKLELILINIRFLTSEFKRNKKYDIMIRRGKIKIKFIGVSVRSSGEAFATYAHSNNVFSDFQLYNIGTVL